MRVLPIMFAPFRIKRRRVGKSDALDQLRAVVEGVDELCLAITIVAAHKAEGS